MIIESITCHIFNVKYQDDEAVFSLDHGNIIEGKIPNSKRKLVEAWIEIHKDELLANWQLAINGEKIFSIEPLK